MLIIFFDIFAIIFRCRFHYFAGLVFAAAMMFSFSFSPLIFVLPFSFRLPTEPLHELFSPLFSSPFSFFDTPPLPLRYAEQRAAIAAAPDAAIILPSFSLSFSSFLSSLSFSPDIFFHTSEINIFDIISLLSLFAFRRLSLSLSMIPSFRH
jgi:hypothetical protein